MGQLPQGTDMNPYNHNPFATDTTRDTRSEYAANRMLRDNARAWHNSVLRNERAATRPGFFARLLGA